LTTVLLVAAQNAAAIKLEAEVARRYNIPRLTESELQDKIDADLVAELYEIGDGEGECS